MNTDIKPPMAAVVIPVYCKSEQHEEYLKEALQSIADQTFRDFEVIIVDDVSPRDIRPILSNISGLPMVRCIRNELNSGPAESRNIGVRASNAKFIAFMDHDDLWMSEKLARQVETFQKNPEAGLVFCAVEVIGAYSHRLNIDQTIIPDNPSFFWLINHGNYIITASSVLVRRDLLVDSGFFDSRYSTCDDFDMWLKIVRNHPIVFLREKLASYRLHAYNANYGVDRLNDNRLLTRLLLDYWAKAPFYEKIALIPRIIRKLIGRLYFHVFRYRRFNE